MTTAFDTAPSPAAGMPRALPYLPQLDGIRALAVLLVFVGHCGLGHVVPGGFGVTVFFFLSGYLITTLLRIERAATGRVSLPAFYLRRSLRILPAMYLSLALTGALYALGLLHWMPVRLAAVVGQAIFLTNYPGLFGTENVLPIPLWSLAIEEHFYLVFPLVFALALGAMPPRRAAAWCLAACAVVLAVRYLNAWRLDDFSLNYSWTHTRIDAILFGCCLALWNNPVIPADRAWRPRPWHVGLALAVIAASLLVRDEVFRQTLRYTVQSAALFVPFAAVLHGGRVAALLSSTPLRRLGLYSYSFYLVHMTVIALVQKLRPEIGPLPLIAAAFPPSLALSMLFYAGVERPCARLRRHLLDQPGRPVEPSLADGSRAAAPAAGV